LTSANEEILTINEDNSSYQELIKKLESEIQLLTKQLEDAEALISRLVKVN
jgi:hypothetical protein